MGEMETINTEGDITQDSDSTSLLWVQVTFCLSLSLTSSCEADVVSYISRVTVCCCPVRVVASWLPENRSKARVVPSLILIDVCLSPGGCFYLPPLQEVLGTHGRFAGASQLLLGPFHRFSLCSDRCVGIQTVPSRAGSWNYEGQERFFFLIKSQADCVPIKRGKSSGWWRKGHSWDMPWDSEEELQHNNKNQSKITILNLSLKGNQHINVKSSFNALNQIHRWFCLFISMMAHQKWWELRVFFKGEPQLYPAYVADGTIIPHVCPRPNPWNLEPSDLR